MRRRDNGANGANGTSSETLVRHREVTDVAAYLETVKALADVPGGLAILSSQETRSAAQDATDLYRSLVTDLQEERRLLMGEVIRPLLETVGGLAAQSREAHAQLAAAVAELSRHQSVSRELVDFLKEHPALLATGLGILVSIIPKLPQKIREDLQGYIGFLGQELAKWQAARLGQESGDASLGEG